MRPAAGPGWRAWTAVAAGALVGTELRYGLDLLFPEDAGTVPWTTLSINVSGSFVLATLTTLWIARPRTAFWLRAGIGPGLLGSFTTFSAVVFSLDQQARSGHQATWLIYRGSRCCWDSVRPPRAGRQERCCMTGPEVQHDRAVFGCFRCSRGPNQVFHRHMVRPPRRNTAAMAVGVSAAALGIAWPAEGRCRAVNASLP